jgi:hypothetical protein
MPANPGVDKKPYTREKMQVVLSTKNKALPGVPEKSLQQS